MRLALGRVDLARHDRRARLVLGQPELAEPTARPRAEQANVVGDLGQADRQHVEGAGQLDRSVLGRERLELVRRGDERQTGDPRHLLGEALGEARKAVEAGADRRAALSELVEPRQGLLDPSDAVADLLRVARELLTEGERRRVLEMGAADLDDLVKFCRLGLERRQQVLERRQELAVHLLDRGDVHRGREGVVGRLAAVDVVVRVHRRLGAERRAEQLVGPVGDHLVGVHVGLGAGAGLPHHQREMLVEPAVRDLLGRARDRVGEVRLERGRARG